MSESEKGGGESSWFEAAEHLADGALEATGHFVEKAAEEGAKAFEAVGATAEDAAKLVSTDAKMIPGVSEVVGVAQTAYHAGAAIGSAITGDWDGAADHALSMAESAGNVATGGILGLAEGAYDLANAAGGGSEHTDAHHEIKGAVESAGNWLGDTAFKLINGDSSGTGGADSASHNPGTGGADSAGHDPGAASTPSPSAESSSGGEPEPEPVEVPYEG